MAKNKEPIVIRILPAFRSMLVPIDSVKPDPRNPRKLKSAGMRAMKKSLKKLGVHRAIIANGSTKLIIIGHQMWAAMKELGQTEVPVAWTDETDAESVARNIVDNRAAGCVAGWDKDMLDQLLMEYELDLDDYSMGAPDEKASNGDRYIIEVQCTSEEDQDLVALQLEADGRRCKKKTIAR